MTTTTETRRTCWRTATTESTIRRQQHCRVSYLLLLLVIVFVSNINSTNGLKHHFHIQSAPSLVGPIGEPFGFLEDGHYQINLFDYYIFSKKKRGKDLVSQSEIESTQYTGGFWLKSFANEDAFYEYMEKLYTNRSICSYENLLDTSDDIFTGDDDDHYKDTIEQQQADDGILLKAINTGNKGKDSITSTSDHHQHSKVDRMVQYTFKKDEAGLYFLIYQVCPFNPNLLSSFHIDFHFMNYDAFGNVSYLSAGEVHLPLMYLFFSISYALCFLIWFFNILEILRGRVGIFIPKIINSTPITTTTRQSSTTPSPADIPVIHTIHYLMALMVLLKCLSVFFDSVRFYKIQVSGHAEFLSFIYYTVSIIKGTFLFTLILLIGTGWSSIKSSLNKREKNIFTAVLILQVVNNIAIAILSQENIGEIWYGRWAAVMHFVDIVCCCIIIVPIVWQVNELERTIGIQDGDTNTTNGSNSNSNGGSSLGPIAAEASEKELALERLRQFRTFYIVVIGYVYCTRIFIYLFASDLNYKHTWIQQLVVELITLTFYVTVGFMFKPIPGTGQYRPLNQQQHEDDDGVDDDTVIQEDELELINRN